MPPNYQQQPTLQNARIRTAQDALQVFFAVARNVLTLLTRRLDADERKAIRSGNVYIWEDRSASTVDNGGLTMERWYARCCPPPSLSAIALMRPSSPPSGPTECHGGHRAYERLVFSFPNLSLFSPTQVFVRNAGVSVLLPERPGSRTSPERWRVRSLYLRTSHCLTLGPPPLPGE